MSPEPRAQAILDKVLAERPDLLAGLDASMATEQLGMLRGRSLYYDRGGEPLSMRQWAILHNEEDYVRVAWTEVGPYHVSTVWLGLDHNYMGGTPIIFESMVFASELSYAKERQTEFGKFGGFFYHESFDEMRYCTEQEALAGHETLCSKVETLWEATRHLDPRLLPPPEDHT